MGYDHFIKNASPLMMHYIESNFFDIEPFSDFLRRSRNEFFRPDINGYNLIYLISPYLSSPDRTFDNQRMREISRQFSFLALEFGPPETSVKATEESSGSSIRIPYATGKSSGGQLSINFLEDSELNVTKFHTIWVNYINDIIYGEIEPGNEFITPPEQSGGSNPLFGALDYASSAYVVKFKPDMRTITYIGKATGIFPINIPSKEIIGSRQSNEMSMVGMNYMCADFNTVVGPVDLSNFSADNTIGNLARNHWVITEFRYDLKSYFGLNPDIYL